jgi:MFS family permease
MSEPYQAPANGFRTFVFVWLSQSVSVIGTSLTLFAINIWLAQGLYPLPEQKPQLAAAFSALNITWFLSTIIMTPVGGSLADRRDRKRIMLAMDVLSGLLSLTLAFLIGTGRLQLWSLLLGAAVSGSLGAIHGSAFDTAYAMLVRDDQLPRANGMMQTMWSLSNIISPGLAALLIALPTFARNGGWGGPFGHLLAGLSDGSPVAIALDGITFLVAAFVLSFLTVPSPKRTRADGSAKPAHSLMDDVKFGANYVWRRRPLLWLLGTFAVVNMMNQVGLMQPLLLKFNLAASWAAHGFSYETGLALWNSAASAGALVSGIIVSAWGGLKHGRVWAVVVSLLVTGLIQFGIGMSGSFYLTIGLATTMALFFPVANTHSQAIWQTQVPRELQGRVFATRRVIAQATGPLGMALAGALAARFDAGYVTAGFAVVLVLFCIGQLFNRNLLHVEDKEYLDRMAESQEVAAGGQA